MNQFIFKVECLTTCSLYFISSYQQPTNLLDDRIVNDFWIFDNVSTNTQAFKKGSVLQSGIDAKSIEL